MTPVLALPTGARGRALAAAIALLFAALLYLAVVMPGLGWYAARQERLAQQLALAARMEALRASLPALRRTAQDGARVAPAGILLQGATDQVAAAALQQKLDEMAAESGLHIGSAEVLPAEPSGAWRAIAVRVAVRASWPEVVTLLQRMAESPIPMLVDGLQLRGPPQGTPKAEWVIDANFTVTAYRDGKAGGP